MLLRRNRQSGGGTYQSVRGDVAVNDDDDAVVLLAARTTRNDHNHSSSSSSTRDRHHHHDEEEGVVGGSAHHPTTTTTTTTNNNNRKKKNNNNPVELATAVAVATTSRMVEHEEGHHGGEPNNNGRYYYHHHSGGDGNRGDNNSDEELCVWTDTYFDHHHRPGMIQAVFDHYPPSYRTGVTWGGLYSTLLVCTAGGTAFSLYVIRHYDDYYYQFLLEKRYCWIAVVVFFLMLVAVIACDGMYYLEKRYPSRIILHTALTCSGIRHELVPEEFATKMRRPCVIKIPYSEIASIRFVPWKNNTSSTDKEESIILQVVTKSTDDETKYIANGIPLRNHTFVESRYPTKEVALNLHGLMEPYTFKHMVMTQIEEAKKEKILQKYELSRNSPSLLGLFWN